MPDAPPPPESPLRVVTFDLDGTMVNSEDVYCQVGTATLARFDGPQALEAANGLLELLDAAKDRQERLTLNKLADKFKKHKVAKALGRPRVELLVVALLVAGVLKEDLGWTAYATTSYLVNGLGHGRRCTDEPDLRYVAYGGGAGRSKKRKASA